MVETKELNKNIQQHNGHNHTIDPKIHPHINDPGHEEYDAMIIMFIALVIILLQVGLFLWKTHYNKSFVKISLVGIWLFPIGYSLYNGFIRMILVWTCFSSVLGYLFFISTRQPLSRKTPKIVFMWFYLIYITSFCISLVAGVILFSNVLGVNIIPFSVSLTILFYGLYIGLLGRDFAEVCSDRIASILGLGGSRLPFTKIPDNYCAICSTNLKPIGSTSHNNSLLISDMSTNNHNNHNNALQNGDDQGKEIERRIDKFMNLMFSEKPIKLPCNHNFHEWCIRGWVLVGKKNTCPHCNEKVDFKSLSENPWQKNSVIWGTLLDSVRHLVVWNPILLFIAQIIITLAHKY